MDKGLELDLTQPSREIDLLIEQHVMGYVISEDGGRDYVLYGHNTGHSEPRPFSFDPGAGSRMMKKMREDDWWIGIYGYPKRKKRKWSVTFRRAYGHPDYSTTGCGAGDTLEHAASVAALRALGVLP